VTAARTNYISHLICERVAVVALRGRRNRQRIESEREFLEVDKKTPTKKPQMIIRGTLKCPTGYAAPPIFLSPTNPRSQSSTYILRSEQAKSNAKKGTPRATLPLRFT